MLCFIARLCGILYYVMLSRATTSFIHCYCNVCQYVKAAMCTPPPVTPHTLRRVCSGWWNGQDHVWLVAAFGNQLKWDLNVLWWLCEGLHVGEVMTSLNDAVSLIYVVFHKVTCDRMHLWTPQCLFTNVCVCECVVFAHRRHRKAISAGLLSGMMSTFSCKWIDLLSAIMC